MHRQTVHLIVKHGTNYTRIIFQTVPVTAGWTLVVYNIINTCWLLMLQCKRCRLACRALQIPLVSWFNPFVQLLPLMLAFTTGACLHAFLQLLMWFLCHCMCCMCGARIVLFPFNIRFKNHICLIFKLSETVTSGWSTIFENKLF